jgi:DNA ligase-1
LQATAHALPVGTVLDGEVLAWNDAGVMPFAALQRRINRKTVGKKLLAEVPVRYVVFDLLEWQGIDLRSRPFGERRRVLEETLFPAGPWAGLQLTEQLRPAGWSECAILQADCRTRGVEGLMLKRASGEYGVGRPTGLWWKWKVQPMTCDAVLIYAQKGHGRRASLFTDYTFAVWNEGALVPFAKAYSGLSDAEIREVDRFIRDHTQETFGPVRSVTPELVFELAFEGIQPSPRHKSGIAVRFPRMLRWRRDKRADQADSLQTLRQLLAGVAR